MMLPLVVKGMRKDNILVLILYPYRAGIVYPYPILMPVSMHVFNKLPVFTFILLITNS